MGYKNSFNDWLLWSNEIPIKLKKNMTVFIEKLKNLVINSVVGIVNVVVGKTLFGTKILSITANKIVTSTVSVTLFEFLR